MTRPSLRTLFLVALVLALVAGLGLRALRRARAPGAAGPAAAALPRVAPQAAAPAPPAATTPAPAPPSEPPSPPGEADPFADAWATVDLEEVRAALPDNSYWEQHAPTTDERVLRERDEARARRNEAYGKVLSGTGSDEEIRAYFEERQRASTDAIQFADYLLEHHADELTERDQELLHLARRLHLARLQEIPRRLEEAFARRRAQDEARAAWLADEARFAGDTAAGAPGEGGADTAAPNLDAADPAP